MVAPEEFDEERSVGRVKLDHLYSAGFGDGAGRYFNVITEEDGPVIEYEPPYPTRNRIKLTVKFLNQQGQIAEVTLKKFKFYKRDGWVEQHWGPYEPLTFTYFSFQKIAALLKLLTELDLVNTTERRLPLYKDGSGLETNPS